MGRLLEKRVQGTSACIVQSEKEGFTLIGKPDRMCEFDDLVREATLHAGEDFVVFPVSDSMQGYSRMFIIPLAGVG